MCLCCLGASKFDPQQSSLLPGYLSPGGLPPSNTGLLKCTLSLQKGSVFPLHIRVRAVHISSSSCWHGLSPRSCRQICPWSIFVQTFPRGADPTMIFIWSCFIILQGKIYQSRKNTFIWILIQKNIHILGAIRRRGLISWGF